jgi:CheY-like chemotaxis protein
MLVVRVHTAQVRGVGWEKILGKVLVVDDDRDLADVCSLVLATEGYETGIACNGIEAVEAINNENADVVLLDIKMPLLDGLSVCKMVKENPSTSRLPVIIMSASEMLLQEAGDVSADAVIAKPFDIDILIETVNRLAPAGS